MNESLVADGPTSEVERSGLLQDNSAFKTEHPPQYKPVSQTIRPPKLEGPPSHKDHLIPLWET
jgi:hypothetical protein